METKKRKFDDSFDQSEESIKRTKTEETSETPVKTQSLEEVQAELQSLKTEFDNLLRFQQPSVKKDIFQSEEFKLQLQQFNSTPIQNPNVFPLEFKSLFSKIVQDSQQTKEKLVNDLETFLLKKISSEAIKVALDLYAQEENYGVKEHPIVIWECINLKDIPQVARTNLTDFRKQRKQQKKKLNEISRQIKKLEKEEEKLKKNFEKVEEKSKKKLEKEHEKEEKQKKKLEKEQEKKKKEENESLKVEATKKPKSEKTNAQSLFKFFSKKEVPKQVEVEIPVNTVNQHEVNEKIDSELSKEYSIEQLQNMFKSMKQNKTRKAKVEPSEFYKEHKIIPKVKAFQYSDSVHYFGTFSKKSTVITGRRPFAKDDSLDYEFDDEEEYEDEGENLTDTEEEEDLMDEELDEDGFIVDDEEDVDKENRNNINVTTVFIGPYQDENFENFKVVKNFEFGEKSTKDEWKCLTTEKELIQLIDLLNSNSKKKTVELFNALFPKVPKNKVERQIMEIARREKRDDKMKWVVYESILDWKSKNESRIMSQVDAIVPTPLQSIEKLDELPKIIPSGFQLAPTNSFNFQQAFNTFLLKPIQSQPTQPPVNVLQVKRKPKPNETTVKPENQESKELSNLHELFTTGVYD